MLDARATLVAWRQGKVGFGGRNTQRIFTFCLRLDSVFSPSLAENARRCSGSPLACLLRLRLLMAVQKFDSSPKAAGLTSAGLDRYCRHIDAGYMCSLPCGICKRYSED